MFAFGLGLVILIGVLGFTPFLTGFVFLRNAVRACRVGRPGPRAASPFFRPAVVVGLGAAVGLPWLAQVSVDREVRRAAGLVQSGDPAEVEAGARMFERLGPIGRTNPGMFDGLVWEYEREGDGGRRARLEEAYRRLTGEDIGHRLMVLRD